MSGAVWSLRSFGAGLGRLNFHDDLNPRPVAEHPLDCLRWSAMSARQVGIRVVLRVMRWVSWSGLAAFAIFVIIGAENGVRSGRLNLPTIELSFLELFAVFCCAVAVDRAFSLGEKTFRESD